MLLVAVLCLLKVDNLQAQEEFKGSRSIRGIVSQSDLNNFVLGGRAALEMILAQEKVQGCTIRIRSTGTDLEVYIEYPFNTYEEYKDITQKLLGYEPITTYGDINVSYVENFTPVELFNFLNNCMEKSEVIEEIDFLELLKVEKDTMVINGDTYENIGALNTSDKEKIMFNNIEINTELSNNIYTRTIAFSVEEDQIQGILRVIKERCRSNDMELQENGTTNSFVTFSANSETQLIKKTMLLLGVPVNINHKKYFNTKKTVRMETKESLDVESILTEGGHFSYELILPESYENLSATLKTTEKEAEEKDKKNTSVASGKVCSNGREGEISFYYDAPLAFDNISIFTDVSDESYKIKRTITFYMDWNIADEYYETVKKELKKRLDNGDVLKIYDNQGYRYYEITHSSWSEKEIEAFTDRIFEMNNSTLKIKRSAIPFVKSRIQDKFNIKEGNIKDYSGTVDIKYMLPDNTKVTEEVNEGEEGKNISLISKLQVTSDIEFFCFHYGKCVVYILGIIVTGMVFFLCISYLQKHFRKQPTKREGMREKSYRSKQSEYCSKCGSERKHGAVFCWKCGSKI